MTAADRDAAKLEVRSLTVHARLADGTDAPLIENVSFSLARGEILGLMGESGSGKSITALAVLGLLPAGFRVEGQVLLDGIDILHASARQMRSIRGAELAMVFQEPMTALDPVFTIGEQLSETLRSHRNYDSREITKRTTAALDRVGMPDPERRLREYPHQLSGGMRQRALIAMALIAEPSILVADEPTTALDVTVQAQILELLRTVSRESDTSILFISHDNGVISEICHRAIVMYAGQVVETTDVDDLLESPQHPYTSSLLWASPRGERHLGPLTPIAGRVPPPNGRPPGCWFEPRCVHRLPACAQNVQALTVSNKASHLVRCQRHAELSLQASPFVEATRAMGQS